MAYNFADVASFLLPGAAARRSLSSESAAKQAHDASRKPSSSRASRRSSMLDPVAVAQAKEAAPDAADARVRGKPASTGDDSVGGSGVPQRRSPRNNVSQVPEERSTRPAAASGAQAVQRRGKKRRAYAAEEAAAPPGAVGGSGAQRGNSKRSRAEAVTDEPAGQTTPSGGKRVRAPQATTVSRRSPRHAGDV